MSEENKVIELNDEDLEKVSGGVTPEKKPKNSEYGCPWNYTLCNKANCVERPDGICSNLYYYNSTELRCSKKVVGGFGVGGIEDPKKDN